MTLVTHRICCHQPLLLSDTCIFGALSGDLLGFDLNPSPGIMSPVTNMLLVTAAILGFPVQRLSQGMRN